MGVTPSLFRAGEMGLVGLAIAPSADEADLAALATEAAARSGGGSADDLKGVAPIPLIPLRPIHGGVAALGIFRTRFGGKIAPGWLGGVSGQRVVGDFLAFRPFLALGQHIPSDVGPGALGEEAGDPLAAVLEGAVVLFAGSDVDQLDDLRVELCCSDGLFLVLFVP